MQQTVKLARKTDSLNSLLPAESQAVWYNWGASVPSNSQKILKRKLEIWVGFLLNFAIRLCTGPFVFMAFILKVQHGVLDCLDLGNWANRDLTPVSFIDANAYAKRGKSKTLRPASLFVGDGRCILTIILWWLKGRLSGLHRLPSTN